jgi:hypothetical protein
VEHPARGLGGLRVFEQAVVKLNGLLKHKLGRRAGFT